MAVFPAGYRLVSAALHGASFWTRTARINIMLPNGHPQSYFLKVARGDVGKGMVQGEYEGVKALYKVAPDFVPRPVGWGTYAADQDTFFYLCDFVDMIEELPDMSKFCSRLAKMHTDSMKWSQNGKFGFHIVTYEGSMYQDVTWSESWEELFILAMKAFAEQERKVHGESKELQELLPALYTKVCPRLLRPLQTGGRTIRPVLVHGDLWYGNMATNAATGGPIVFDPSVFWAHNEYDLDNMNVPRYRLGKEWMREYHLHVPKSAPEEDYDDRNLLYGIHGHFCASTLYPSTTRFRQMAIDELRYLVDKYPSGYEGYEDREQNGNHTRAGSHGKHR
ncbi:hypothetical protein LTR72_010756 [Exophiala xenobiotica]|nr:hypothetical protein LTR72_010756 [Exophiala xenobiotica]KAK5285621.1 hypothetical protein LTR14_010736 [Exophiala xenobiotica]KAK5313619.1 hypothetical protein LTR93_010797 [Exophiala xenobiotica]KAK5497194.1 hypothetical protein LTR55_001686 [Exophiala xenobiotica]